VEGTTMGYASTSVTSGHCPSVRRHLNAGVTVASAGILALGLVAAPPGVRGAGTEVRQVQLAAFVLSPPALLGALEKFISDRAQTVVPVTKVVADGAADVPAALLKTPTADETTPPTFDSAIDPAINPQKVDAAGLAATTTALSIPAPLLAAIPEPILAIVGITLLFGPIILLVILACPPCALFNFVTGLIQSFLIDLTPLPAVALASTATVEAIATTDPSMTSEPLLSDSAPATTKTAASADAAPASETGKADVSPTLTSTDTVASTSDVTETAETEEESTEPTAASGREPAASASTPEPAKASVRPATPRPVVRDSLRAGEQLSDLPHRGNGSRSTTRTAAVGDGAAEAGSPSVASSSAASTGSKSTGGDSSSDDAGDS
jgi:hypothetical protein